MKQGYPGDTRPVESITNVYGSIKYYEYGLLGRLQRERNEMGETTEYYDELSKVLTAPNPQGYTDSFTYDLLRRIKTVTDKNGNVTGYNYDANGNIIETVDAMHKSSFFEYDAMNRLTKVALTKKDPRSSVANQQQMNFISTDIFRLC